ncbi:hypothetical protein AB0H23_27395 [Streptomyces albogriseolus]|uniref:hypothetical protein n=1 Tax=Streptomyces albogriseolus TaxID=1887 RepID=UPI003460DCB7
MLARRKAALERAAERMAERRREAEDAEAQRLRREAEFDELVADFELAVEDEAAAVAAVEEEVARVRERGRVRVDAARVAAARVVLAMGEAGETVAGCGQRLGVGVERVKELRRLGRESLAVEGAGPGSGKAVGGGRPVTPQQETAGGSGGEERLDGGSGAGRAGAVPVTAPLVTAPAAPPATGTGAGRAAPAGGSSSGGPAEASGGGRPGWLEPSR